MVQGVPTSFGWKALIENLKIARNFEIFCQNKIRQNEARSALIS